MFDKIISFSVDYIVLKLLPENLHSTKVLSDTFCIFAGYLKRLNADKSHHFCDFLCIIKIHSVVFVHFKSSCNYQFIGKTMTSTAKWRLKPQ